MPDGKWTFGTVNINSGSQVMFGDNNQMHVDLAALKVPDPPAVVAALGGVSQAVRDSAVEGPASLSADAKSELHRMLSHVVDELKKPQESQDHGFLRKCLGKISEIAAAVPAVVTAALKLKALLGF